VFGGRGKKRNLTERGFFSGEGKRSHSRTEMALKVKKRLPLRNRSAGGTTGELCQNKGYGLFGGFRGDHCRSQSETRGRMKEEMTLMKGGGASNQTK